MNVELHSIIQIKTDSNPDEFSEKFEFWADLPIIFKRGLLSSQKRLSNCTRWQLTAFESDVEGNQLFDEIATLCYDLMDQHKAYLGFNQRLKLIQIPSR